MNRILKIIKTNTVLFIWFYFPPFSFFTDEESDHRPDSLKSPFQLITDR